MENATISILGVSVSNVTLENVVGVIERWIANNDSRYVCVADSHSIIATKHDPLHKRAMQMADMITPDGIPIVWLARAKGSKIIQRVCGTDLMLAICDISRRHGWRNYFYGSSQEIQNALVAQLSKRFPGINIAGGTCPPFRTAVVLESYDVINQILETKPNIIWVSLGCPKQEIWMEIHQQRFPGVTMIGVGAAFGYISGLVPRSPIWMQKCGLEWFHRLYTDPRRLWRRYLTVAPEFMVRGLWDLITNRRELHSNRHLR